MKLSVDIILEGIHYCNYEFVKKEDVKKLNSKPLLKLEEDDLAYYHGNPLYSLKEVEHYKYFIQKLIP